MIADRHHHRPAGSGGGTARCNALNRGPEPAPCPVATGFDPLTGAPAGVILGFNLEGIDTLRKLLGVAVQSVAVGHSRYHRDQMPPLRHAELSEATEPTSDRRRATRRIGQLWTYVPTLTTAPTNFAASLSAPATPASISDFTLPQSVIELFVTSNGKPMQRPLSWRGWVTRPWLKLLSGVTLQPSTAALGAGAFISSLPVIPANHSAWLESGADMMTRDTSGLKCGGSSPRSVPSGCSARTLKATSTWAFPRSAESFTTWATALRQACSQRVKSVRTNYAAGSSFWPTPTAADKGYVPDLAVEEGVLRLKGPIDAASESGGQFPLCLAARSWTVLWMLARGLGLRPTGRPTFSRPLRATFRHGNGYLSSDLISNPRFYEAIMGWPIGWTAPGESVTGFAAWLRRSRSALCALPSPPDPAAAL